MKFSLNQRVNHISFGQGTIVEIEERTFEKDGTREPLLWVEFDSPAYQKRKTEEDVYKVLFSESSLTAFTTE